MTVVGAAAAIAVEHDHKGYHTDDTNAKPMTVRLQGQPTDGVSLRFQRKVADGRSEVIT